MSKEPSWDETRSGILEEIVPKEAEIRRVEGYCRKVERELSERLSEAGYRAVAEVHGSVARGTWLAGVRDFDVFIVLDRGYDRGDLPGVLDVVKGYVGEGWTESYAEHPYVIAEINDLTVEFVPCFRVDPRKGLISATDRTPLHTAFVKERLDLRLRDEVRLLKRLMEGIRVYGAEVRVWGFSGYLCELLVIALGPFEAVLERAAKWKPGEIVDLVGASDPANLRKIFTEPLIVPDPVDPGRNVASAVSEKRFWEFSAAARAFLEGPDRRFFFPPKTDVNPNAILRKIRDWGLDLLFIVVEDGQVEVPDILWGQLYRSERAVLRTLVKDGFIVVRSGAWSDEEARHFLVFELESAILPRVVRRMGPPVGMAEDSKRFLEAHGGSEETVSGPWVEEGRWWVTVNRKEPEVRGFVSSALHDGGVGIGVSRGIAERVLKGHRVLLGGEIGEFLDGGLASYLDRFLKGRPGWLD